MIVRVEGGSDANPEPVYFDNDIILKLAGCDLLDTALRVLQIQPHQAIVLPTAKFGFLLKKPQKGEAKYGAIVFGRIRDFINAATEVKDAPNLDDAKLLGGVSKNRSGRTSSLRGSV